jgi:ribosomal-protein-alanine N-acetyltransferase
MRADPDVNRYLGGPRMQNPEALTTRMEFYLDCYEKFGFGQCPMIWKETGELIGCSGIQPLEQTGEIEVGYSVAKKFWRMGIGYECAYAWIKYGFENAGLERIVAVAHPDNIGSWKVMEKCGMQYEATEEHYGQQCVLYAISKTQFLEKESAI